MTFSNHDAVLAECEALLRQTLELVDGYRVNRLIAARLAHLLHDVSDERHVALQHPMQR